MYWGNGLHLEELKSRNQEESALSMIKFVKGSKMAVPWWVLNSNSNDISMSLTIMALEEVHKIGFWK